KFLEENWLFEAITETYIPLLQVLEQWKRDSVGSRLTLTLTPTLCAMLQDKLLRARYSRHLAGLLELAEKEIHRTHWQKGCQQVAEFYRTRLQGIRDYYEDCGRDLISRFRQLQEQEAIEIITSAATHAVLPLLASHPPSLRAQLLIGRDYHAECF